MNFVTVKNIAKNLKSANPLFLNLLVELPFYYEIPVDAKTNEFIETMNPGDRLLSKKSNAVKGDEWFVNNEKGKSIGYISIPNMIDRERGYYTHLHCPAKTRAFKILAEYLEISVERVLPLSKRTKRAKWGLLYVKVDLKPDCKLPENEFALRTTRKVESIEEYAEKHYYKWSL